MDIIDELTEAWNFLKTTNKNDQYFSKEWKENHRIILLKAGQEIRQLRSNLAEIKYIVNES